MFARWEMFNEANVRRPHDRSWVLRASHHEASVGNFLRGAKHEALQRRLPIGAVGAEITEIPTFLEFLGKINSRVDRAIKRTRTRRTPLILQLGERGAAGERKIHVVARDELGRKI